MYENVQLYLNNTDNKLFPEEKFFKTIIINMQLVILRNQKKKKTKQNGLL